jgi:hypothetical protein
MQSDGKSSHDPLHKTIYVTDIGGKHTYLANKTTFSNQMKFEQ